MIQIEGKLNDLSISILIDSLASYSYANTNVVERYKLVRSKFLKNIMVLLAMGMRRKITSVVKDCCFIMDGLHTNFDWDIIHLGLYDFLIGMNWIELHHVILDFH